jgi:zinc transport system ATP-binding protein
MKKLIEIKNLTFGYFDTPILEDVNLDIFDRDHLLILGPNGGGKTTLLKLVMGILRPWNGSIIYENGIKGKLGYVPQFSEFNRNFPITVLETVLTSFVNAENYLLRPSNKEHVRKAEELIHRLDLAEARHKNINDLSGGQLQRLLIARALVSDPAVLFLDEPTTSIDLPSRVNLFDFIRELNQTTAVVIVTHDPTPFAQLYQHVACVNRNLYYHDRGKLDAHALEQVYGCPVELLGHGIPHVFLHDH